eukprot:SAG11_NODE_38547_length_251_cov_58.631579_1_plen_65_part_10
MLWDIVSHNKMIILNYSIKKKYTHHFSFIFFQIYGCETFFLFLKMYVDLCDYIYIIRFGFKNKLF